MTSAAVISTPYSPYLMDLTAEEITPPADSWIRVLQRHVGRWSNTMAFRIAVPPFALWAALYSLVEYIM